MASASTEEGLKPSVRARQRAALMLHDRRNGADGKPGLHQLTEHKRVKYDKHDKYSIHGRSLTNLVE